MSTTATVATDDLPEALRPYEPDRRPSLALDVHLMGDVAITFEKEAGDDWLQRRGQFRIEAEHGQHRTRITLTVGEPCFADAETFATQLETAAAAVRKALAK